VIIPALNEEGYIAETLDHLRAAEEFVNARARTSVEILVVDNGSTDGTIAIAQARGVVVIREPNYNIAKARNAGAHAAAHQVLVFVDADTLVPPQLLLRVGQAMADPACQGGAVDALHRSKRLLIRAYLRFWRVIGILGGMAQGACQFYRREMFVQLGGYDESLYMGEDVDLFWRLRIKARQRGLHTCFIRDLQVVPSSRRWDQWPLWRTLVFTNPLVVLALRRRKSPWSGWYREAPR
jgi:glycosyltransferase involved in cell wall biosynthesis